MRKFLSLLYIGVCNIGAFIATLGLIEMVKSIPIFLSKNAWLMALVVAYMLVYCLLFLGVSLLNGLLITRKVKLTEIFNYLTAK